MSNAEPLMPSEGKSTFKLILEARTSLAMVCSHKTPKENFVERIAQIAQMIRDGCMQNRDVALATILHQRTSRYSILHSVDTAILSHIVGGFAGIPSDELQSITSAALTMNISMLHMQDELQCRAEPLTPVERQTIQDHPEQSVKLLRKYGVEDELWLNAVGDHHEIVDGSGYPSKKLAENLLLPMRILTVSDIYCARVSGRDYRKPLKPSDVLRKIFLGQDIPLEKALSAIFIKALGLFPPGAPLLLKNGELAVVVQQGEKPNLPVVCSLKSPRGESLNVPVHRNTKLDQYGVREAVHLNDLGEVISLEKIWGKDAALYTQADTLPF